MADRELNVALRIQADLADARRALQDVGNAMADIGRKADGAGSALTRSSSRFDALLASVSGIATQLTELNGRFAAFASGAARGAQASTQVAESATTAATSVRTLGETEEEAAARIRAMVAASREQVAAMLQTNTTAAAQAATVKQSLASRQQEAALIARQTAQMGAARAATEQNAQSGARAAKVTAEQRAELTQLLGSIDPTIKAYDRLDRAQEKLAAAHKAGLIDQEGFDRFNATIERQRAAIDGAGESMHKLSLGTSQSRREFGRLATDMAAGNWGRFSQTSMTLANYTGAMGLAFTGAGAAILGVVGTLALFAIGAAKGWAEVEKLRTTVIATGGAVGVGASQLDAMATAAGRATGRWGEARQAVQAFAASGQIASAGLGKLAESAVDVAIVTGQNIDQAAQSIISLRSAPAEAIAKLNEQYHFLTAVQYEQIAALEAQGRTRDAARIAEIAYTNAMHDRAQEVEDNAGWIIQSAHGVRDAWNGAWEAVKGIGKAPDLQQQIDALNQQRQQLLVGRILPNGMAQAGIGVNDPRIQNIDAQVAALRQQQWNAALKNNAAQLDAIREADAIAASKATAQFDSPATKRDNAIALASRHMADQLGAQGLTDEDRARIRTRYANEVTAANEAFASTMARGDQKTARVTAAKPQDDRAALAAQQSLLDMLQQMQGALDPTAAAWVRYNKAVADADRQAAQAKTARGADVPAINAERDAVVQLAATMRDADLERIAAKDEEAWTSLLASLRTPAEVNVDRAVAQLDVLNQRLAAGKISSDEYHQVLNQVAERSVGTAPQSRGLDAAVGGIGSELNRNLRERAALDQWHQEAIAANEKFRASDLANEDAYQARKVAIQRQYDQQKAVNDQARNQLALATTANVFGQLAALSSSHNRKMALIGKTAAIAQAIISTYQSATEAYKAMAGIPYVGPALGIAAAAAAIAAGMANVAQIRAQPVGGYAEGGYTGSGGKYQVAGWVHAGEGVLSQRDMRALGGPEAFESFRRGLHGYADGGVVGLPSPAQMGFTTRSAPQANINAGTSNSGASAPPVIIRPAVVVDRDGLAELLLNTPTGERLVLQHVGDNPRAIRVKWGA